MFYLRYLRAELLRRRGRTILTLLGLAIARQVAEAHGGSVTAERPDDGGTLVRLSLIGKS